MTRKIFIAFLVIFLVSCERSNINDGTIKKFYGDAYEDIGYSISGRTDGYYISAQLEIVTRDDNNVIKLHAKRPSVISIGSDGNILWQKVLTDTITGSALKVLTVSDGSVICTGFVNSTLTSQDIFVARLDNTGNITPKKYLHPPVISMQMIYLKHQKVFNSGDN